MSTVIDQTITLNIVLLATRLAEAAIDSRTALQAIEAGRRNEAIGTLLPLKRELTTVASLLDAILALHRMPEAGLPQGGAR